MTLLKKLTLIATLLLTPLLALNNNQFINSTNCNQVLDKTFFQVCYDHSLKVAKAVSYTLAGDLVNETNIVKRPSFKVDREIDRDKRTSTSDYTKSGYDRGHMANDAAFDWSQESLDATYKLSNIVPQVRKVNRYTWSKAERYARFVAVQLGEVNVINLIEYTPTPQRIGKHQIAVPKGFYKILYNNDQNYSRCLYYKNDNNIDTKADRLKQHDVECSTLSSIVTPTTQSQTRRTCSSFSSHLEAQTYFNNGEYGWARLDGNHNGIACESLR
jgi:endonuclease G